MYEQYFGFSTLPFAVKPAAGEYYFSEPQRRVLDALEAHIVQGDGISLLRGSEGVGKTTLVQSLCATFVERIRNSNIDASRLSDDNSLGENLLAIPDTTEKQLLIVDNAESLTAVEARALDKFATKPGLHVLLLVNQDDSGAPADAPAIEALSGSITSRHTLLPFAPIETDTYIRVRLIQAGGTPELFSCAASDAVFRYSGGLPRLINRVYDLALIYGFSRQCQQIDDQIMAFVLKDRWGGGRHSDGRSNPPDSSATGPVADSEPASRGGVRAADQADEVQAAVESTEPAGPSLRTDAAAAVQLIKLLQQGGRAEASPEQTNDRDIYDFIRLSMRYQQRHLERFTLGVAAVVVLLLVGGVWGFLVWQEGRSLPISPLAIGQELPAYTDSIVSWQSPPLPEPIDPGPPAAINRQTGVVKRLPPAAVPDASHDAVPVSEQAALESRADGEKIVPDPGALAKQAALRASIAAENRALHTERDKLAREQQRLKKKLAAQQAENERLKRESERERARARGVVVGRKSAQKCFSIMG